jgi:uridine kinase
MPAMTRTIAIAGGSASGKTTLARALCDALGDAALLEQDAYYKDLAGLPEAARTQMNFDQPGALDLDRLADDLAALRAGRTVQVPRYDFARHTRAPECDRLAARPFLVVAGIHLLAVPGLRAAFDLAVFLDTPAPERLRRRIARDTAERGRDAGEVRRRFEEHAEPALAALAPGSRAAADLLLDGGAPLPALVGTVLEALRARGWLPPAAPGHNSGPKE